MLHMLRESGFPSARQVRARRGPCGAPDQDRSRRHPPVRRSRKALGGRCSDPPARAGVGRGDRCFAPGRKHRRRRDAQPCRLRVSQAGSTRSTPRPPRSKAFPPSHRSWRFPESVEMAVVTVPAAVVSKVARECAQKGVRGLVVISAGFGEAGPEGVALQRRAGRDLPVGRNAAGGPQLHGRDQHRARSEPRCDIRPGPAGRRPHRIPVPERRPRVGGDGACPGPRVGALVFCVGRQQGRPFRQRLHPVLGGGSSDGRDHAVPRVVRKSAQVRARGASRKPLQADPGREERAHAGREQGDLISHRRAPVRARTSR